MAAASVLGLVKTDSTGTGAGSVGWTYKVTDGALDFLAAGETLTAAYTVTINDGHGGTVTQPVTVTVPSAPSLRPTRKTGCAPPTLHASD